MRAGNEAFFSVDFPFVIGESPIASECFAAFREITANYFPFVFGLNMILQIFIAEENGAKRTRLRFEEEGREGAFLKSSHRLLCGSVRPSVCWLVFHHVSVGKVREELFVTTVKNDIYAETALTNNLALHTTDNK